MTLAPLRLVFDPVGEDLDVTRQCELDVFLESYGNTAEQMAEEYGPYEDQSVFFGVIDDEAGEAVAAGRLITNGPAGLKTLNDAGRPPWEIDGEKSALAAGLDLDRTWDVATIASRKGKGRGGLCAAAIYHAFTNACFVNDAEFCVAIIDSHARSLLSALGMQTHMLPGTRTAEYLGSSSSTPLWGNVRKVFDRQHHDNPDAYRLIVHGTGLDGIALPTTDWKLHRGTRTH